MTLPITPPGPLSASQINTELKKANNSVMNLNASDVRQLTHNPAKFTSNSLIRYSDFSNQSFSGSQQNFGGGVYQTYVGSSNGPWSNMPAVLANNGSSSCAWMDGSGHEPTYRLHVNNFGFTIPNGANITNITVFINHVFYGKASARFETISIGGYNRGWYQGLFYGTAAIGGSPGTWGVPNSNSFFNSSSFEVNFHCRSPTHNDKTTVCVYWIQIRIDWN